MTTERASRVVVGFDGSDEATDAVRWGAAYAAQHGWSMLILTAVAISGGWSKAHDEAEKTYRPRLEAAASETASRQNAMHTATENARNLIDSLTRKMNASRQASITQELTEIIGSADALNTKEE